MSAVNRNPLLGPLALALRELRFRPGGAIASCAGVVVAVAVVGAFSLVSDAGVEGQQGLRNLPLLEVADEGVVRVFEEWQEQAALDAHFEAPHMAAFMGKMGGLGITGMDVKKYEVSSVGPVR